MKKYNSKEAKLVKIKFYNIIPFVNIITPITICFYKNKNHIIELSRNTYKTLFGVTIITKNIYNDYEYNRDLTKTFDTIEEAKNYIDDIDKKLL